VIYERSKSWWNDIDSGESSDSSTRALWKSYQQRYPVVKQEEMAKEIMNLAV
jgi:hypothetical protein